MNNANINHQSQGVVEPPLIIASRSNKTEILWLLLTGKADINVENKYGYTALMNAAYYGNVKSIQLYWITKQI